MTMRSALVSLVFLTACGPKQTLVVMNDQNNSGQSGYATLTEVGDKTDVLVMIHRSDFPVDQPVHFHPGRCGEIGVKRLDPRTSPSPDTTGGELALGMPNLRDPANPRGVDPAPANDGGVVYTRALLDVKTSLITSGDFVINVHDARDFALYVSCGNIN